MTQIFTVHVFWRLDGPSIATRLDYDETPEQRQAMLGWSVTDYVAQAFDAEFPDEENTVSKGTASFECDAIVEGNIRFIF